MTGLAQRARDAVSDQQLQGALRPLTEVLNAVGRSARSDAALAPRREHARRVRRETLADLDGWIDRAEAALAATGVTVHHAATRSDARRIVVDLARRHEVDLVVKAKSMATEEIEVNDALAAAGVETVETDLGEYIVQLAGEKPSHIVGPALHKRIPDIARLFSAVAGRPLPEDAEALCEFARGELRDRFLRAGMGVTGANFVAADTGTIVLVTNEGNGRMCTSLPRVHVAVVPVEKIVPRLADVPPMLPVLTRHASGQPLTTYVSMITGPRRAGEVDGPDEVHVVFLDHHRRALVGTDYEEMLACIRCGACLNVCPVYGTIGGHAYDSVYSGPMGAVLTPLLSGGREGRDLPDASSLCGACTEACPVGIPLADMLVQLRADLRGDPTADWPGHVGQPPRTAPRRLGFAVWSRLWASPRGYRWSTAAGRRLARLARVAARRPTAAAPVADAPAGAGWARSLPFAAGWAEARDVPVPPARSFCQLFERREVDPGAWRAALLADPPEAGTRGS